MGDRHPRRRHPVANTMAGESRGDWEIVCPFAGISSWTIAGGSETRITEICMLRRDPGAGP